MFIEYLRRISYVWERYPIGNEGFHLNATKITRTLDKNQNPSAGRASRSGSN
jgi:hypothetical protein